MSEFSSVVVIQTNEAGQPTNLVAFSEGDTLTSSVLPSEAKQVVQTVEDSSASWDAGLDSETYNNIVEVSSGFKSFSGNSEACTLYLSTVLDTSVGSGLVDVCSYIDDNESNWNAGGLSAAGFENWNEVSVGFGSFSSDVETSVGTIDSDITTLQGQVPSAPGFDNWNTIYGDRDNIISVSGSVAASDTAFLNGATPTLTNDLNVNNNDISDVKTLSGVEGGVLDISGTTMIFTSPEGGFRLGTVRTDTATWTKVGVEKSFSAYDYSLSAWETVSAFSSTWGGGGGNFEGSAIASAISIGNSSSVLISGVDGAAIDLPQNNQVLALDTAAERFVYRTVDSDLIPIEGIEGGNLANNTITGDKIANGAVSATQITDGQITSAKLESNISIDSKLAANDIGFNSLRLIGAETLVGNKAAIGGPMDDLTTTEVKTMLGLDPNITVGTTAPTSPSEGDLWYDTTTGVDDLFAYDSGRTKWLSVATRQYYFARNAATTASHAHLGPGSLTYNAASRIGYFIPYDMTIVGYAWNQGTTAGEATDWTHRLQRYNLSTSANSTLLDLTPTGNYTRYKDMTLNTDFDADGLLGSNLVAGGSATSVQQQTITVFMKRRTS